MKALQASIWPFRGSASGMLTGTVERIVVLALIVVGAVARLAWVTLPEHLSVVTSESYNVAVSLATTGRFADPLGNGGGYTAHVSMLTPLPSAFVYWLLGAGTPAAELTLSIVAIALVSVSFWICWRIACLLDVPLLARIASISFLSLAPLQFGLEIREAKNWEIVFATSLLLWIVSRILRLDHDEYRRTVRQHALTGALIGFLFVLNPPAGLAAGLAFGLYLIARVPVWSWIAPAAGFLIVTGLLAGFWAARNEVRLGEPVPSRDNFGLELAISNYSGALHPADPKKEYLARIYDIHPLTVGPANAKLAAAGGELPYYKALGREAQQWIVSHPGDFLYLSARRYAQFYLPPRWFWGTFGATGQSIGLRQALVWITTLPGLVSLLIMARIKPQYRYLLLVIIGASLTFTIIQPMLRYRYLVSSLLILLSFDAVVRSVALRVNFGYLYRNG